MFSNQVLAKRTTKRKKPSTYREFLSNFVELFQPRSLFDTLPKRSHLSFKRFRNAIPIPEERKGVLKSRLLYYSTRLDRKRPDIKPREGHTDDVLYDDVLSDDILSDDTMIQYNSTTITGRCC